MLSADNQTAFPGNCCRQPSATIDGVDGNAGVDQRRWNDQALRMMYGGRRAYFARACAGRWPLTDLPTGAKPGTSRPNQWQRWRSHWTIGQQGGEKLAGRSPAALRRWDRNRKPYGPISLKSSPPGHHP